MGLKSKLEAIIYAAEEPITVEQIAFLMKEPVVQELATERERAAAEEAAAKEAPEPQEAATEDAQAAPSAESEQTAAVDETAPVQVSDDESIEAADQVAETTDAAPEAVQEQPAEAQEPETVEQGDTTEAAADSEVQAEAAVDEQQAPEQPQEEQPAAEASEKAKPATASKRKRNEVPPEVRARVKVLIQELVADYASADRGIEIRQLAGGYRMATKPEHHDIVKAFAKSLKPPLRLSLPALETLAVIAYKQPVTAPEVSDIRGVESAGVVSTLLERKLITTAGRKAVIGRPILYKTTKEFLLRFGLNDTSELPSMEEFEKIAQKEFFSEEVQNETAGAAPDLDPAEPEETTAEDGTSAEAAEAVEAVASADVEAEPEASQPEAPVVGTEEESSELKPQD